MVDIELYRIFYIVAKCGSLTKAADQLFISQPAVSQAIKQLETGLGVALFSRNHKGMKLSEFGTIIYADVEKALRHLEIAENRLDELQSTPTGMLRLGATDAIFAHLLSDKLVAYHEKFPAVKLELVTGTTPETCNQLKDGRVDIGVVNLPINEHDVRLVQTVTHLNDVFIASENFAELKNRPVPLAELKKYPLLMIEANTVARKAFAKFCENIGVSLVPDVEVGTWDFMKRLAARGMGVGCLPMEYCKREIERGELFVIDTYPKIPVRGIGLAVANNAALSFAHREFIKLFANDLQKK